MSDEQITFGFFGPPDLPPVFQSKIFVSQVVGVQEKKVGMQHRVTLSLWDGERTTGIFRKDKPNSCAEFSYKVTKNILGLQMLLMLLTVETAQTFIPKT